MGRRLLQSGTAFLLQSGTVVVTKWDRCYKVRRMLLQSGTGVTKCDDCYKVGSNKNTQLTRLEKNLKYSEMEKYFLLLIILENNPYTACLGVAPGILWQGQESVESTVLKSAF